MVLRLFVLIAVFTFAGVVIASPNTARLKTLPEDTRELTDVYGGELEWFQALKRFPKLERLEVCVASRKEACWKALGELSSLRELTIRRGSSVIGEHFVHLAKLTKLEVLIIQEHSGAEDVHLGALKSLRSLRRFEIVGFLGSGDGFAHLAQLPHLECLHFAYAPDVEQSSLAHFVKFPVLKELGLIRCEFLTDESFDYLSNISKLEVLNLDAWHYRPTSWTVVYPNEFTGKGVKKLGTLKQLRHLNLRGSYELQDVDLKEIASFKKLEYLNIGDCPDITDAGVSELASMPNLRHLVCFGVIYDEEIRGGAFAAFKQESRLDTLEVPDTYKLATGFFESVAALPRLRTLNCEGAGFHDEGSIRHLAAAGELRELNIRNLEFNAHEFAAVCKLRSLERLVFGGSQLSDEILGPLRQLTSLRELEIWPCGEMTDVSMGHIGKLGELERLSLTGSWSNGSRFTDKALEQLKDLQKLRSIELVWLAPLGKELFGLDKLRALQSIRIDRCSEVGAEALGRLLSLPRLRKAALHSVAEFPAADEVAPPDSLESLQFDFSDEEAIEAAKAWAKKYPLLTFHG